MSIRDSELGDALLAAGAENVSKTTESSPEATTATPSSGSPGIVKPILYTQRWHMLAIYCTLCMLNQLVWITFAPIDKATAGRFGDVSAGAVNLLAVVFPILFLPGMVLADKSMSSYSLRSTMVICATMMTVGCLLRLGAALLPARLGQLSYGILLAGQGVVALAQPFVLNIPGMMAGRWFGSHERDLATTIGTLSNIVGQAMGQALSPVCVAHNENEGSSPERGFVVLLSWQLGLSVLGTLWTVACFRSRPPTPPNYCETKIVQGRSLLRKWRDLLRNRQFLVLLVVFGVGLALFTSFVTLLDQFLKPCGYSSNDSGNIGAVLVGSGIIGAAIVGSVMDVLHAYRPALKGTVVLSFGVIVALCFALRPGHIGTLYAVSALLGMVMIATLPVVVENSLECTYPTSEEVSVGILFLVGNTLSIGFTYVLQWLLEVQGDSHCGNVTSPPRIFLMSLGALLGLVVLFYNGQYLRLKEEQRHKEAMERNETLTVRLTWGESM